MLQVQREEAAPIHDQTEELHGNPPKKRNPIPDSLNEGLSRFEGDFHQALSQVYFSRTRVLLALVEGRQNISNGADQAGLHQHPQKILLHRRLSSLRVNVDSTKRAACSGDPKS